MNAKSTIFKPIRVGSASLQHRIAMAPMTRLRTDPDTRSVIDIVADYYTQRAAVPGTLLISEASAISRWGAGEINSPGLWNETQLSQFKKVADAVHSKGSFLSQQLWTCGRTADPEDLLKLSGKPIISASDIPLKGRTTPTPLTRENIAVFVSDYVKAAKNAIEKIGADFVEIHSANGYLLDQFIQDVTNNRTDEYGGSVENRARFVLEVVEAVCNAVGSDKVGIRLSPNSTFNEMGMKDPVPQFSYIIEKLSAFKLAYLHLGENRRADLSNLDPLVDIDFALKAYKNAGPIIVAGGWTGKTATEASDSTYAGQDVLFAFGKPFISNPDLVYRVKNDIAFSEWDPTLFYGPAIEKGYLSYPFSKEYVDEVSRMASGGAMSTPSVAKEPVGVQA